MGVRRCGQQGKEDVERDRGRERQEETGRGAERNVLGLDRQEDMAILTALCLFTHRKTRYSVNKTNGGREHLK